MIVMTGEESGIARGGRPRSLQSQQALLDATLHMLATKGFDAMSIEDIASRAGVSKKTIYRWWTSKEALVIDAIKALQQEKSPVIDTGSLREDLTLMLRAAFLSWGGTAMRGLALNLLAMVSTHAAIYQVFHDQVMAPRFQQFAQMIERAQERGEVRRDIDANEVIGLPAGFLWYQILLAGDEVALDPDKAEMVADIILRGIAVPAHLVVRDANERFRHS